MPCVGLGARLCARAALEWAVLETQQPGMFKLHPVQRRGACLSPCLPAILLQLLAIPSQCRVCDMLRLAANQCVFSLLLTARSLSVRFIER